jgi:hypothetical protein
MPTHEAYVQRFAALFAGYDRAFGQYLVNEQEPETGKNVGPRSTKTGALTLQHYRAHLDNTGPGLGVIMLREDNNVLFAALDVDNYRLDLPELEKRVTKLKLPLTLCRTKSGGAHLYLFLSEPASAEIIRTKLAEWVSVLNLSNKTEIFPKQSTRAGESDIGSWINVPYQNESETMRYAVHRGKELELPEFLDLAESRRISLADLLKISPIKPTTNDPSDPLYEAPPCLVTIHQQNGFPSGTRNDGMLAVGTYLKKRFGEEWESHFAQYNELFCNPPLEHKELYELTQSLRKKEYFYRCKQPPIHSVCQQRACAKREFGVGGTDEGGLVQIEALAVNGLVQYSYPGETEESLWGLEIRGVRLMVPTEILLNPSALVVKIVETGRILPSGLSQVSKPKWHKYLEPLLLTCERLDMNVHTGAPSPLWESTLQVLKSSRRARSEEHYLEDIDQLVWQKGSGLYFTFSMLRRFLGYRSARKQLSEITLTRTLESYGAIRKRLKDHAVWYLENSAVINYDAISLPDKEAF